MKTLDPVGEIREVLIAATDMVPVGEEPYVGWSAVLAERIAAALGLDDLDAAARRAARALWDREQASEAAAQQAEYGNDAGVTVEPEPFDADDPRCDWYWQESRRVLEAALTATEGPSND